MKIKNGNLNEYEPGLIEKEQKRIFKICLLSTTLILILLILFLLFSLISFQIVLGYIIGALFSMIFFYHIIKVVKEHHPIDYVKAIRKMRLMHQLVYLFLFVGIYLLFSDIFAIVSCLFGLLMIRFSILIDSWFSKGNEENV